MFQGIVLVTHGWLPPCRWRWSPRLCWTHGRCTSRCARASGSSGSESTSSSSPRLPLHCPHPPGACCPSARRCLGEGYRSPCTSGAQSCPRGARSRASSSLLARWNVDELQVWRRLKGNSEQMDLWDSKICSKCFLWFYRMRMQVKKIYVGREI